MNKIIVQSSSFINYGNIPDKYTCNGEGNIPQISWRTNVKAITFIVYILDETVGFVHYIMYNIPGYYNYPKDGILGKNSSNYRGYYPICPKDGINHLYSINVLALNTVINPTSNDLYYILNETQGNVLAEGKLSGYYRI